MVCGKTISKYMERRPLQPILGREGEAPTAYAAGGGDVSPGNSEIWYVERSSVRYMASADYPLDRSAGEKGRFQKGKSSAERIILTKGSVLPRDTPPLHGV